MTDQTFLAVTDAGPTIERLGWVLVHSLWQFGLIAFLAMLFLSLLKKSSAALRHGVLLGHLALFTLIPPITWIMLGQGTFSMDEAHGTETLPQRIAPQPLDHEQRPADIARESTESVTPSPIFAGSKTNDFAAAPPRHTAATIGAETIALAEPPATSWWNLTVDLVRPWLGRVVAIWALGLLLFSLRPIVGWWALRRLKTSGLAPVPETIRQMAISLARRMGLAQKVEVFQSYLAKTPLVVGYFQPVILLPVSVVTGIPASQLESILIHELAHVRRHDFLVNLLQTLVETGFFYHPAVWFLSSRIRIERENCCDDLVVGIVSDRAEYGRALLAVEELRGHGSLLALGATHGSLLERVRRILAIEPVGAGRIGRWHLIGLAPLLLGVGLLFGPLGAAPHPESTVAESTQPEVALPETGGLEAPDPVAPEPTIADEPELDDSPLPAVGRILMSDGSPAAGAEVRAVLVRPTSAAVSRREAKADAEGRFRLLLPSLSRQDGEWVVSARHNDLYGQFDKVVLIHERSSPAMRPESEKLDDLKLQPGRKIEGWVLEQKDRRPLHKATVWSSDGQKTETDDKGAFVLNGLSRNLQTLLVTHPSAARTLVQVDLSEQSVGRVKVLMPAGGMVQGEVTQGGQPVKNGHVYWGLGRSQRNAGATEAIDPKSGKFSFGGLPFNRLLLPFTFSASGMEPEESKMIAVRPGQGASQQFKVELKKAPLLKGTDFGAMREVLYGGGYEAPTGSIRGQVLQENGQPLTEFTVHLIPGMLPSGEQGSGGGARSFFSEDGTFAIGQLDAGKKYAVAVTSPSFARAVVSPVTARVAKPETSQVVEIAEFRMKPATLQVDMTVVDAVTKKPIPDAMVGFKTDVRHRNDFSWDYGLGGAQVQWTDGEGKIHWNRMEIDQGIFFVQQPGYGRGYLPWRIAQIGSAEPRNQGDIDKVHPLKRNAMTGRYEAVISLNPEAKLEVKINQAGGRDLNWIGMDVEQMSMPLSGEPPSAANPLVNTPMLEFPAKGGLFRFEGLNPGPCKLKIRDLVDEHGGNHSGLMVREIDLVSGVYRLELDLPPRAPAKSVKVEKKEEERAPLSGGVILANEASIQMLELEKKLLLQEFGVDHPKVKKLTLVIEHLKETVKSRVLSTHDNRLYTGINSTVAIKNDPDIRMIYIKPNQPKHNQDFIEKAKASKKDMQIRMEELKKIYIPEDQITPLFKSQLEQLQKRFEQHEEFLMGAGEGSWNLEEGAVLEITAIANSPSRSPTRTGTLRVPGFPQKALFGPTTENDRDFCVCWIRGGTTVWAVTRSERALRIHEVRFGPKDPQNSNEIWSKESTIPWASGQVIEEAGIPTAVAARIGTALTGSDPVVVHRSGKWLVDRELTWEIKEQSLVAPLLGPAKNYTGFLRKFPSGELVRAIPLGMIREKDHVDFLTGWQPGDSVLWVAKKEDQVGEVMRIDWKNLKEQRPATQISSVPAAFPSGVVIGGVEIPKAIGLEMALQFLAIENKRKAATPNPKPEAAANQDQPQIVTGPGTWKLKHGVTLEVKEETFHAPIVGSIKLSLAVLRRPNSNTAERHITLGSASDENRINWIIGWLPGSDHIWRANEEEGTHTLSQIQLADLTEFPGGSYFDYKRRSWSQFAFVNDKGIPKTLKEEMSRRFRQNKDSSEQRRETSGNTLAARGAPEKNMPETLNRLQGTWRWQYKGQEIGVNSPKMPFSHWMVPDPKVYVRIYNDRVFLSATSEQGFVLYDKEFQINFDTIEKDRLRLNFRSISDDKIYSFNLDGLKWNSFNLTASNKTSFHSTKWERTNLEGMLAGTWKLAGQKSGASKREFSPLPAGIALELTFRYHSFFGGGNAPPEFDYDLRPFHTNVTGAYGKQIPGYTGKIKLIEAPEHVTKISFQRTGSIAPDHNGTKELPDTAEQKAALDFHLKSPMMWQSGGESSFQLELPDNKTLVLAYPGGIIQEWKRIDQPGHEPTNSQRKFSWDDLLRPGFWNKQDRNGTK